MKVIVSTEKNNINMGPYLKSKGNSYGHFQTYIKTRLYFPSLISSRDLEIAYFFIHKLP